MHPWETKYAPLRGKICTSEMLNMHCQELKLHLWEANYAPLRGKICTSEMLNMHYLALKYAPLRGKTCTSKRQNMHLWKAKYAPLKGKQDEDGPRSRLDHQGWLAFLLGVSHCGTLGFGFSGWFHKPWISGKTNGWEMLEGLVCEMYD